MKIFSIDDCEWFAAETLEDAIQCACTDYDYNEDNALSDPRELTDEEMETFQFTFTDKDDQPTEVMSFRAALAKRIADGESFPCLFASTEY